MQDRVGWTKEQVQARAHELWVADGCPDDNAQYYWYRAECELEAERQRDPKIERLLKILCRKDGDGKKETQSVETNGMPIEVIHDSIKQE